MYYKLFLLLILLTIYSDSPLQIPLSYFGRTFIPVVVFPLYFFMKARDAMQIDDPFLDKYQKLLKYTIGISLFALIVCLLFDFGMTHLGEFLPFKMIKLILIYFSYYIYIIVLVNLANELTLKQIFQPFFFCLIIITVIAFVEVYVGESFFNSLHFGDAADREWDYNRVRLLCSESSFTAPLIEIFLGFSLYYSHVINKTNINRIVTYVCGGLLLITTGSKTLMFAMGIALLYTYFYLNRGQINGKRLIQICFFVVVYLLYLFVVPTLESSLTRDIQESTSTVTRSYTVLMGYIIGTLSILGTGFQSYIVFFPEALNRGLGIIDLYMADANLSEIGEYIFAESGQNIGAKSFLAQSSMYWGIFGTIHFVKSYWKVFSDLELQSLFEKVIFGSLNLIILFQLLFSADMDYIVLAMLSTFIILKNKNYDANYSSEV